MARLKVRRTIIREWMSLTSRNRRSRDQATVFARDAVKRYDLPKSQRAPFDTVMAWLLPRTGKP
ncbi:uncharacterized protein YozE (UPF0346 family) [Nitrobacteraceae bacterium AZCC 1564]